MASYAKDYVSGIGSDALGPAQSLYSSGSPGMPSMPTYTASSSVSTDFGSSFIIKIIAFVAFIWYFAVLAHAITGTLLIFRRSKQTPDRVLWNRRNDRGSSSGVPAGSSGLRSDPEASYEGVTILRPLKGIDTEMDICLRSGLEQVYPQVQTIFCIEDPADPALPMVESLISKYPQVDTKVMVGSANYGPNPKVNNLAKGYLAAMYDMVWVLDSNVWVSPDTLARAMDTFRATNKSLISHVPMCISLSPKWATNWGSRLDEMFMLTAHAKFYTALNAFQMAPCVMGKSNLYRRSDLDKAVGAAPGEGIRKFALYIAEDNMIADALWAAGGRTAISPDYAIQPLDRVDLAGYWNRRVRWLRVRRYMVLAATLLEPTTESLVCGAIGSFGVTAFSTNFASLWSWRFYFANLLAWCVADYWQFHILTSFSTVDQRVAPMFARRFYSPEGPPGPRPVFRSWLWVWALREVLALPIWIVALMGHEIYWRGRPFIIKKDLTAEEI